MHSWNFAIKRVKLGQLSTAPVFEWKYGYEFPGDFLRLVSVHDSASGGGTPTLPYKIEGNQINTDAANLYLRYVYRVTDPNLMIPLFRTALSKLIASRLAVALSQSASRSDEMYKQFIDQDLPTAKSADSIQDFPDELPESTWVSTRYGSRDNEVTYVTGID